MLFVLHTQYVLYVYLLKTLHSNPEIDALQADYIRSSPLPETNMERSNGPTKTGPLETAPHGVPCYFR